MAASSSSSSDSSSSGPSVAVIGACAAVGGLILIFLIVRIGIFIHRKRKHPPVPLPPARPLAALQTLPWNANPNNASKPNFSASKLDLSSPISNVYHPEFPMPQHGDVEGRARIVYRQYSGSTLNTEEMPLRQPSSPITRTSTPLADGTLVPPQPYFFSSTGPNSNRSSAALSLNSTEESDFASYPPQRNYSVTNFPTDPLSDDSQSQRNGYGSSRAVPHHMKSSSRAASISTTYTTGSMRSSRTQSTLRGPAHRPHSRVEIVLPAPLAPPSRRDLSYLHDLNESNPALAAGNRKSACDPWIRIGREGTDPVSDSRRRSSSRERPRHSRTAVSEPQAVLPSSAPRTRQSRRPSASSISSFSASGPNTPSSNSPASDTDPAQSSYIPSRSRKPSLNMLDLPPVPRVPSIYANSPSSSSRSSPVLALSDSITGNGRMRGLESDATIRNKSLPSSVDLEVARAEGQ